MILSLYSDYRCEDKITSQKPDRFPKPVRFEAGNYLSEKL
jgi:hypothetical protein